MSLHAHTDEEERAQDVNDPNSETLSGVRACVHRQAQTSESDSSNSNDGEPVSGEVIKLSVDVDESSPSK